jgi:hypothetical protein
LRLALLCFLLLACFLFALLYLAAGIGLRGSNPTVCVCNLCSCLRFVAAPALIPAPTSIHASAQVSYELSKRIFGRPSPFGATSERFAAQLVSDGVCFSLVYFPLRSAGEFLWPPPSVQLAIWLLLC